MPTHKYFMKYWNRTIIANGYRDGQPYTRKWCEKVPNPAIDRWLAGKPHTTTFDDDVIICVQLV